MDKQPIDFMRLSLRAPEPEDLDILYIWENDESAWHTSLAAGPLSRHQISEYLNNYEADLYTQKSLRFIIETEGGQRAGTVDVFDYEPRARHAFIGIYIAPGMRGRGLGTSAIEEIKNQMAQRHGLKSLAALVAVDNLPSRKLFEKSGFVEVGCLKDWVAAGRRNVDGVLYQWTVRP